MKALTIRVPLPVWQACVKRMADDLISWHDLLLPVIEEYGRGGDASSTTPRAEALAAVEAQLNWHFEQEEVTAVIQAVLAMLQAKKPRR
jgi:hypothetical protein